jgi:hypothetical protein
MLAEAQAIKEQLIQWRRTIHRHPQLRFEVYRTAQLVAYCRSTMPKLLPQQQSLNLPPGDALLRSPRTILRNST